MPNKYSSWANCNGKHQWCELVYCVGTGCSQSNQAYQQEDMTTWNGLSGDFVWAIIVHMFLHWAFGVLSNNGYDTTGLNCGDFSTWVDALNPDGEFREYFDFHLLPGDTSTYPDFIKNMFTDICNQKLMDWFKGIFPEPAKKNSWANKNENELFYNLAHCENSVPDDVICYEFIYNQDYANKRNPLQACNVSYLSDITENVYFARENGKPESNTEHYDGLFLTTWKPINVYGPVNNDGTPSDKRLQAVVDEVNIRKLK